mgnify:CR=1 FL=1
MSEEQPQDEQISDDIRALKPDAGAAEHRATVAVEPEGDMWCVKRDGVVVARKIGSESRANDFANMIARDEPIERDVADADSTEGA